MPDLLLGVCVGVLLTLAVQWALQWTTTRTRKKPPVADVLQFPAQPAGQATGFLDSILEEETEDEAIERLKRNLRVKVFHNEEQMQRLIESERKRQPQSTMRVMLEAAIERWERDNR